MESVSGEKPMVRYWMHTGFLNVMGEKMSKSLGNFLTIRDFLQDYDPEVFRFFVLSTHYRSPIDFSKSALEQSKNSLNRICKFMEKINHLIESDIHETNDQDEVFKNKLELAGDKFLKAMDNDFNTPEALSIIFDFIRDLNRGINEGKISKSILKRVVLFLIECGSIFGIKLYGKEDADDKTKELIEIIKDIRKELRDRKDWELSDLIRSKLKDLNIVLEDK
jgi:cysteinyl-tRNA synthetase